MAPKPPPPPHVSAMYHVTDLIDEIAHAQSPLEAQAFAGRVIAQGLQEYPQVERVLKAHRPTKDELGGALVTAYKSAGALAVRLKQAATPPTARTQLLEQLARAAEMVDQKQPNEAADAVLQQCVRQLEQMAGMTGHGTAKIRDDQAPVRTKAQKFDLQAAIRGDYGPGDLTL